MRALAEAWPDEAIVQEPLAQMIWYHDITLLEKVDRTEERLWYARQATQAGWSRNVLVHQIESGLYARQGRALSNFDRTLPPPRSDLARQMLKDHTTSTSFPLGRRRRNVNLSAGCWPISKRFS